jgi:glycosyltransferase involved in cell wall biosynthesis
MRSPSVQPELGRAPSPLPASAGGAAPATPAPTAHGSQDAHLEPSAPTAGTSTASTDLCRIESGTSARRRGQRRASLAFLGSRGIPARYGGFETFVQEVSVRLVDRGYDVTVFCEAERGAKPASSFHGVRLEHVRAWAPGPLRTLQFDASCLLASLRRFDVVYMLGYGASAFCALPRAFGQQVWINMDGLEWRRSKWSAPARAWLWTMERLAFASATRLVYDNARLRDEVETRRDRRSVSSVIEYGADVYVRDDDVAPVLRRGLVPGDYDIVVCRPEPENHLLEIVRAHRAARTARPLAVVGNVDIDTAYARDVRDAAGPGVVFLGGVYDPLELRPLRRHAHACLHGHSVGGTNPSLLEAMGCGNLVLAHENPFNRETLDDAALFWSNEAELVAALRTAGDLPPARLAELRASGIERVRTRYSWERITDEYERLLVEVAR